jgi:iron complex transport system substrate-binding protein
MPGNLKQGSAFVSSMLLSMALLSAPALSQPARIVSMNVCTDQLLLLLVDKSRLASVSYFATDPAYSNLVDLAREVQPNRGQVDEVLALAPDLIVTSAFSATFAASVLERLQQRVERLGFATTRDEAYTQIRTIAGWTGDGVRAETLVAETREQIDEKIKQLAGVMTGRNGIAFGSGTLQHDFLLSLGMTNIAAQAGLQGPAPLSLETLVAAQPDFIFSEPRGTLDQQLAHPLLQHPALANSAAVRIALRDRWFDCAGPWLADAYRNTAQQLLNR